VSVWRLDRGRTGVEDIVWSGPRGAFQVDGMHDGRYDLTARTDDGRVVVSRGLEVRPGVLVDGIVLTLEPAARWVVGYEGHAASATVEVLLDGEVLAAGGVTRGTRSEFWVPPGQVRVRFFVDGKDVGRRDAQTVLESRSEVVFE